MVAKGTRDRCSSSSANATTTPTTSTKRRIPSASHNQQTIAKPVGICGFCLGDNEKNANGIPEKMINCAECGNSGHPSCLQYSETLVKKIKTIRWQCIDCKRCIVCNKSDDSLLFCDFCDSGIHPKCCDPPLNSIPKGDFACHLCRDDEIPRKSLIKTDSSSSIRSRRSNNSNEDDTPPIISRPVAQLIDGMSNFFLPNKQKSNNNRQQSVQKAMKYLREKQTSSTLLKRLHSSTLDTKPINDLKNQLLAKSILSSSKTQRIKNKSLNLKEELSSTPQTSTPLLTRHLINKKPLMIDPITPPPRVIRRSDTQPVEELNKTNIKRKHSTNSISPISNASSIIIKKRARRDSSTKQTHSKKTSQQRKQSKTEDDQSDNESDDLQKTSIVTKRKLNLDLSKYKNTPGFLNDSLPDTITDNDIYLFLDARQNSTKLINDCSDKFHHSSESIADDSANTRWPPYIVFGSNLIKTWYSSSYPQEYARVPRLYICEFCLKYMKCEQAYDRHCKKCTEYHPPANEIYHKDDLSVFEVDGNINRYYCQNLCLLAKLFLDHKTLYYDVEPFLFYVLTKNDSSGCHFIGYFSKEKHCPQKYNLSCITILPNCQRRGYGRFLIELSYLLSQKESQVGTPERPLSTLGAQTYDAYWKIKIVEQLLNYYYEKKSKCILKSIMNETGIAIDDIIEALQNLSVLTMKSNEKPVITVDVSQLEMIMKNEKIKHAHWVSLDSEYLRFTPVLTLLLLTNEERAIEKQVKQIQIVFKEIGRDAAEAATLAAESTDGLNTKEGVRYIRRRKFGQKRRSMLIKRRAPIHNKSIVTNDDSCIPDGDDEHSQEYISRRRISIITEQHDEENKIMPISSPSPKIPLKQSTFKQLKLDHFLKVVQPKVESSVLNDETPKSNHLFLFNPENNNEEIKSDINNDDIYLQTRRIGRNTRLQSTTSTSETDLVKIANDTLSKPDLNHQDSMISDGGTSSDSSTTTDTLNSSSVFNVDRPITIKKRALSPSNLQALIDSTLSPSKNVNDIKPDQPMLSRETSVATTVLSETPSSLSDILANPFKSSSLSTNGTDEETKIARIEAQLKTTAAAIINHNNNQETEDTEQDLSINSFETTIKPVESIDDEPPPSLTSPTSMIISQSNHYNYSTKTKQHQQQINNFNTSTNMTYNYGDTSYPYTYPPAPSIDMQPFYYPSVPPMNYIPYYPTSSASIYPPGSIYDNTPEQQPLYYSSNGVNSVSYNGNGPIPYGYPTAQSSSTTPTTQQH